MTVYELLRVSAWPVLPVLYSRVRRDLAGLVREGGRSRVALLDVGGRKSPYTVGLPAHVTILDLPRESESQERLRLGVSEEIMTSLARRRSNVTGITLQDMTKCDLPSDSFDGVLSVEVLEHVERDQEFVRQVARVLRPGGWFYFTTPNGDYVRNEPPHYNPDHIRHYARSELVELLRRDFAKVRVVYGVKTGANRFRGLRSMHWRRPARTLGAMLGNVINHWESRDLEETPRRTAHLFGIAWKA